jgi:hypothetical protein
VTTRLHERIGFDTMTGHRYLTGDGFVQRTWFSSGAVVTVNFDGVPRDISSVSGEPIVLAPNGYHVELDGHRQSKLWVDGAAEIRVQNNGFLYVKTGADTPRPIGPATLAGELAAYAMPAGQWNIRYNSNQGVELDLVAAGILETGETCRVVWINENGQYTGTVDSREDGKLILPAVENSALLSVLPGMDAATPLIIPQEGLVTADQPVSIVADARDMEIRYTLDGTDPCLHTALYTGPFKLASGARIRAVPFKDGRRAGPLAAADLSVEVPLFTSPIVRGMDKPVEVDISLDGLSELHIQVTDANDGPHFDQASLGGAHFQSATGEKVSLTEYPPVSTIRFDIEKDRNNYEGDPISIGGVSFEEGISSHAVDYIVYRLREDFRSFKASVGINDRTSWRGPRDRKNGSVQFIFTGISKPAKD